MPSMLLSPKTCLRFLLRIINCGLIFLNFKYPNWKFASHSYHNTSSWLCKTLSMTADFLCFNFKIISCNPRLTDIQSDLWLHDVPLAKKLTFLNMDNSLDYLSLEDLISENSWNYQVIENFLGSNVDLNWLSKVHISSNLGNTWMWSPKTSHTSLPSVIYSFLNDNSGNSHWIGWSKTWKLDVALRVRTFIWKLAHSRLPICDIFYNLNFGPQTYCIFCTLVHETTFHIFWKCPYSLNCWNITLNSLDLRNFHINSLSSGAWLVSQLNCSCNPHLGKVVIAITHQLIWKARFTPNFNLIPNQAWSLAKDYAKKPKSTTGKFF